MMEHLVASTGMVLAKRTAGEGNFDLPPWAVAVILLTTLVFLPAFVVIGYTLKAVYPTLAIIEDPEPPAYEAVPVGDDADVEADADAAPTTTATNGNAAADAKPKAITSSLRSINRLLYSVGGWRASFRGIVCAFSIVVATGLVSGIFSAIPFVPSFVGTLLATLALVQFHTAWVHIVISNPSPLPFWKRLPAFRRTFEATCMPVLVFWLATTVAYWVPHIVGVALGLRLWDPRDPRSVPQYDHHMTWKSLVVGIIGLTLTVFLVIPAQVVLVRVQASLLPPDEDPIVPFDRSFQGTIEPAIVGGKGYATMRDAFRTFSRSAWIRLYKLYLKAYLVTLGVYVLFGAIIVPVIVVMSRNTDYVG